MDTARRFAPGELENPAHLARPARRPVPPCDRSGAGPGPARPSSRFVHRQHHGRRAGRNHSCRACALPGAGLRARRHPARAQSARHLRAAPRLAPHCGAETRRAPRPRRQGRGAGAAGAEFRPCHPRLYAARRLAGLLSRHHQRRLLSLRGAAHELAHRSLPVRKQLCRRPVPRQDRHAARHGAHRAQRRRQGRIRAGRDPTRRHRHRLSSANCVRSRRSTC